VLAPVGIVLGHISLAQIKRTGEQGRGLAIAGLVIGYIFTGLLVLSIVWMFLIANAVTRAFDDYDSASSLLHIRIVEYDLSDVLDHHIPDGGADVQR